MSCIPVTDTIRELTTHFPQEREQTIANLIGLWQSENPKTRANTYPSVEELESFIRKIRGRDQKNSSSLDRTTTNGYDSTIQNSPHQFVNTNTIISPNVVKYNGNWTREEVEKDTESLYIFTDNTDRDSGHKPIDPSSKYAKKYGTDKRYPTMTQAVIRGLDNAMPISTQRWYHDGAKGESGRWNDDDIKEFRRVIDSEIDDIIQEWRTGKYKRIVIGGIDGFFNTSISNISKDRTPALYAHLYNKLREIGIIPLSTKTKNTTNTIHKPNVGNIIIVPSSETRHTAISLGAIDTLRHPNANGMHFGNPFSHTDYPGVRKIFPTVKEATIAYEQWLKGEAYQDIEPERRQWIIEQINSGNLDGRDLVYYTDKIPDDSYGRDTYDFFEAPNHAHIIQKLLYQAQEEKAATQLYNQMNAQTSFETPTLNSLEEQEKADLTFDPIIRRDRASLLARFFSDEVDLWIREEEYALNTLIMEDPNLTEEEREDLRIQLYGLDRVTAITRMTPRGVFDRVKSIFSGYIEDTEENRIKAELAKINATKGADKYTAEQKHAAAVKRANYRLQEYKKIVDNFSALAEEACLTLLYTENVKIDPNVQGVAKANLNEGDPEGNSPTDDQADDYSKEESAKDGWMTNFKFVSSFESLSQAVRAVIREIPMLDYRGKYDRDDLGFIRYLDADYVHSTLIDKLRYMTSVEDMIPLLEDLSKIKPWVRQIIKKLQNDDVLFSQFYQDFRKDYIQYWIQKKTLNADGSYTVQTIPVNKPEGVYYLLDSWRDNYENGIILDDDSVYTKSRDINKEKAEKGLSIVENLTNVFNNKSNDEVFELVREKNNIDSIIKVLKMIGIDPNPEVLEIVLTTDYSTDTITFTPPVKLLLNHLNIIFSGIVKDKVQPEKLEDGTEIKGDLINTFGSAYNSIALMIAEVTEDAIESSTREGDKTYYSHVNPSYLGKLIKKLKDVRKSPEEFDKFIQEEYGKYDWFKKDGRWRCDWIKQLATDPKARDILEHKVLLSHDKTPYKDWDEVTYTVALLTEYWSDPNEETAWYHIPILSDAPSAEFIKFKRFTNNSETNEDGERMSYQDSILTRMVDIVEQEYDRILLVNARDEAYQAGVGNIEPIANYDIVRWGEEGGPNGELPGTIKSKGGSEFKFFPQLNSIKYDDGETFIDRLERKKEESPSEFKKFITDTLKDIIEKDFEDTYSEWMEIGLLSELPNGHYEHLPYVGHSSSYREISVALKMAKAILGEDNFPVSATEIIEAIKKDKAISDINIKKVSEEILSKLDEALDRGDITNQELISIRKGLSTKNVAKEALREYFWNSQFATSQIIEMTTTDLAFYESMEDFQKRYKEVHAPSLRLNTQATFHGEKIGRDWERTIYLADDKIVSSVLKDIEEIFDEQVKKGELSSIERDYIVSQYRKVNVADAQAYRSLSSYRAMMGMMGQWTDDMETAYKNLKSGNWNMQDFNIIWQTKKPFVYTQIGNNSGIKGSSEIKTPVQHKNSEFLLLAIYDAVAGPLGKSSKLKAINDFMEKENHNIDVVQFESTTKVGKQGIIDINDLNSYDAVYKKLVESTGVDSVENPNVVHKVSYEDYGIQTATPEHAIDAVQLVGTQIRKLITADLSDKTPINVNGKIMPKKEWLDLYNKINTENILEAFKEVDEIFSDPKKVEEAILEEIRGSSRYSIDLVRSCTLDPKTGLFNIPLYDPVQSQRIQQLLNSIIKNRVTKQKIKGGALIQVSSYGVTQDLKIVYEGEGKDKRIKYIECYMPAYSREFYEALMDKTTGILDVNKLPDELRRLIGYRVPTEDKYSMAPLYIKGFLPQQNGSAIMLPAEITTIAGSDFDVDKLYIMLPEFKITSEYDIKSAWDDFYSDPSNKDIVNEIDKNLGIALQDWKHKNPGNDDLEIEEYIKFIFAQNKNLRKYQFSETAEDRFSQWFKVRKSQYELSKKRISRKEYDFSKEPHEQKYGKAARNNLLIDMMWGVLTNPDTASKILNPGGFDKQKKAARISSILEYYDENQLYRILKGKGIESLLDMSLDELNKIAKDAKRKVVPLSPRTQVIFHQQNMTGATMIGIYANHNANHALMQHTDLGVSQYGVFTLYGRTYRKLNNVKNDKGEYISRNNANYLAASVDNTKDNTLYATNQNVFTGDPSMLLSRLGYNPAEIAILMRQPIVMEMTRTFFKEGRRGKSKEIIIAEIIRKYARETGMNEDLKYDKIKNPPTFSISELMLNITRGKDINKLSNSDRKEFLRKQVVIGLLFERIAKTSEALSDLVGATRADTPNGAAGPTIADTEKKIEKAEDFIKAAESDRFPLEGAKVIVEDLLYDMELVEGEAGENIDEIRSRLLNSPLPFLQAFYTLGVKHSSTLLGRYFPHFKDSFRDVMRQLRELNSRKRLSVKTMNSIYNDLLAYIMSKTEFFGTGISDQGVSINTRERRNQFINNFPEWFSKTVSTHPDIANLEFIQRLKKTKSTDKAKSLDVIVFKNVGKLSSPLRDRYMRDWASLLHSKNPVAQQMALNLFRYSFYRNGFAFGPNTFIHLAPAAVRKAVPEYITTLRKILTEEDSYNEFVGQYILNHLDNREIVPEVPEGTTLEFTDEDGKAKDEVVLEVDSYSKYEDKKIVRSEYFDYELQTIIYDFYPYITKKIKGEQVYYRLTDVDIETPGIATYERIEPLGLKNNFLEYEYGKNAREMQSVISKKNRVGNTRSDSATSEDNSPSYEEGGWHEGNYDKQISEDITATAFGISYGKENESSNSNKDVFTTMKPNNSYRDSNRNVICTL